MTLHLIKLCVGCDTVEDLLAWRREYASGEPDWRLTTRQTPKRGDELVDGGSLYRVFRGMILCRQAILAVETVGDGLKSSCEILLDQTIVPVVPTPRRAFQGWRYLTVTDAPADLDAGADTASALPQDLAVRLREIGAW